MFQKDWPLHYVPLEENPHHLQNTLGKKSNLGLIKSLALLTSLQEQTNVLKHHHQDTVSKIEMLETLQDNLLSSLD